MQIVFEDKKIQVLVNENTSILYIHRKFGREWGPAIQITPGMITEVTIDAKECPIVVNMRPK